MIVEKFVKDGQEHSVSRKMSHIRRFAPLEDPEGHQVNDTTDPNRMRLGSVLSKASQQSDQEAASKIQTAARKKMDANLSRL